MLGLLIDSALTPISEKENMNQQIKELIESTNRALENAEKDRKEILFGRNKYYRKAAVYDLNNSLEMLKHHYQILVKKIGGLDD